MVVCRGRLVDLESGVISKVVVELKRELVPMPDMLVECALPCVLSVSEDGIEGRPLNDGRTAKALPGTLPESCQQWPTGGWSEIRAVWRP